MRAAKIIEATYSLTPPRAVEQQPESAAGGGRNLVRGECATCAASRGSCRPVPSTCAWTVQTSLAFMIGSGFLSAPTWLVDTVSHFTDRKVKPRFDSHGKIRPQAGP